MRVRGDMDREKNGESVLDMERGRENDRNKDYNRNRDTNRDKYEEKVRLVLGTGSGFGAET